MFRVVSPRVHLVSDAESVNGTSFRYVALGDSLTEGLGDRDFWTCRLNKGWADRFAGLLAAELAVDERRLEYANLAVRSRRAASILTEQVDEAVRLRPDLVSLMAGANDLWRPTGRLDCLESKFRTAIERLRDCGARVVLATTIRPEHHWAFRVGIARAERLTTLLRRLADEYQLDVLDIHASVSLRRQRFWSADMVHFGERGHIHVANRAAKLLGLSHRLTVPSFDSPPKDYQTPGEFLAWLGSYVLPFAHRVVRRVTAGDGVTAKHTSYTVVDSNLWPTRLLSNPVPSRLTESSTAYTLKA
jgi:phosphatidylinositol alpha 1,6-mannosyltransferase